MIRDRERYEKRVGTVPTRHLVGRCQARVQQRGDDPMLLAKARQRRVSDGVGDDAHQNALATAAREPKRVTVIQANNHRFDGNTNEFYRTLREGLQWMK